jgi:IclR family pca regulon transcriptional regulator
MPKDSDGFVRSISRGLLVIETLGQVPGRHTLAEVAVATELSRATVRRILATLVALNYCESDGRYFRLRPRALGLGLSYLTALPLWAHAQQVLEQLRNEVRESCAIAVLDREDIVYVLRRPSRKILAANLGIGSRLPAHLVSLGRVMLAALPAKERENYLLSVGLKRLTSRTIVKREALRRQLQKITEQGFAWVDGELDPAICGMAVPIRDQEGTVIAAISINTISGSIDERGAKSRFLLPLKRAAQEIRLQTSVSGQASA